MNSTIIKKGLTKKELYLLQIFNLEALLAENVINLDQFDDRIKELKEVFNINS